MAIISRPDQATRGALRQLQLGKDLTKEEQRRIDAFDFIERENARVDAEKNDLYRSYATQNVRQPSTFNAEASADNFLNSIFGKRKPGQISIAPSTVVPTSFTQGMKTPRGNILGQGEFLDIGDSLNATAERAYAPSDIGLIDGSKYLQNQGSNTPNIMGLNYNPVLNQGGLQNIDNEILGKRVNGGVGSQITAAPMTVAERTDAMSMSAIPADLITSAPMSVEERAFALPASPITAAPMSVGERAVGFAGDFLNRASQVKLDNSPSSSGVSNFFRGMVNRASQYGSPVGGNNITAAPMNTAERIAGLPATNVNFNKFPASFKQKIDGFPVAAVERNKQVATPLLVNSAPLQTPTNEPVSGESIPILGQSTPPAPRPISTSILGRESRARPTLLQQAMGNTLAERKFQSEQSQYQDKKEAEATKNLIETVANKMVLGDSEAIKLVPSDLVATVTNRASAISDSFASGDSWPTAEEARKAGQLANQGRKIRVTQSSRGGYGFEVEADSSARDTAQETQTRQQKLALEAIGLEEGEQKDFLKNLSAVDRGFVRIAIRNYESKAKDNSPLMDLLNNTGDNKGAKKATSAASAANPSKLSNKNPAKQTEVRVGF